MTSAPPGTRSPGLSWSWPKAALGLVYAAPAAILTAVQPDRGLMLAIGVLCAAAVGMPPLRRMRALLVFVGALAGLSLFLGSVLAQAPAVVVLLVLFALCVAASVTSPLSKLGPFVLALGVPLVSAGVNITSPSSGAGAGLLIFAGSIYAFAVSLLWPEPKVRPAPRPQAPPAPRGFLLDYGVRLGLAAVLALGLGLALGIDHPAWASTSALMVGRPNPVLTSQRVAGRALSVLVGSSAALLLHATSPGPVVIAVCIAAALATLTAVSGSRWYVTAAFTSFVVLSMMMVKTPDDSSWWAAERIGGTLYGVAIAWVLLDVVPRFRARRRTVGSAESGAPASPSD